MLTSTDKMWNKVRDYAKECSWRAGKSLADAMDNSLFTEWERVIIALDGQKICGYCTVAKTDCIPDVCYTPYIGYMFVGEEYRGNKIDEIVIMPMSTLRRTFNWGNYIDNIVFLARDGISPTSLRPRIERIVGRRHHINPDDHNAMFFFDIAEQFEMVDKLFAGVTLLAIFVGISSLIAGIIGVGNIMWVIVKERTNEIGIRRAIGAKPIDIVSQILSEGMVLTFVAGMAGIVFATATLAVASELIGPGFQLPFATAVGIMVTFMVLGTLAGIIPALKAMKIKPIEAINDK